MISFFAVARAFKQPSVAAVPASWLLRRLQALTKQP
jgi:hypothetical protein